MERPTARIHVLLARDAPVGLVLCRGAVGHVCTLGWDRDRDTFQLGQWFKGRIYEHKCDIAPDGRHWIYFAFKPRRDDVDSWTAVARVPYLKALAYFPEGGTWGGCGQFLPDGSFTAFTNGDVYRLRQDESLETIHEHGSGYRGFGPHQAEHGWARVKQEPEVHLEYVHEKKLPLGWTLRRHEKWRESLQYSLYRKDTPSSGVAVLDFPQWQWADWDRDRLVWAEGGCLHAGKLLTYGLTDPTLLHDFNDMVFERIEAPY